MRSVSTAPTSSYLPRRDAAATPNSALNTGASRVLHTLHARLAEELAALLRDTISARSVILASLEETTAEAYTARRGRPEFRLDFAADQPHAGFLELHDGLAFAMIDALLNYHGAQAREPRSMSEIETQLLGNNLEDLLDRYALCWREHAALKVLPETNANHAEAHEPLYVATYQVACPHVTGRLVMVLRMPAWAGVLGRQASQPDAPSAAASPNFSLLDAIGETMLPARAVLGRTRISIEEFISLRVGDVICLDQQAEAPVEIHVGSRAKLLGDVRIQNGRFVVTVDQIVARGGE